VIRSILASASLVVLFAAGVSAQGPAEPPTAKALPESSRSGSSVNTDNISFAFFGGSTYMGRGASLSLRDLTNDSCGVTTDFRPRFTAGVKTDAYGEGLLGLMLDGAVTMVDSPIRATNGSTVQHKIIRFMDTAGSLLGVVRGKWSVGRPYAGLGPTILVTHVDNEGGFKLAAGMLFVAGARLRVGRKAFGFAEGRYHLLPDRHYTFDALGIQDPPFPTIAVTVSGNYGSVVFGVGYGW
jgi:hypothetical protein